ncbi:MULTISPECIES: VTT domain-containing protein [Halorubrum]|uniref:TVP38/TMEM64 family protein n=1 Tax=Halorubrum ezzemoulense TaxID=337243 RepID=A0A256J4J6_HALEZ|nr:MULTISPECIES: VTT domain-containing protein [Halorubrum]MDB9280636.1 VTT domain-containing protein [Halorubrum ezzemoulense]MDB9284185.1 VTT domain-containing protein [Halorubrum ezzemoulense]OTE98514.1 TVP38/TMEM64 family protein [Halorubrum sp. SD683]OYR63695.1 TVP38/TMEM64 family protein [Halorubrum ezzemoulense]OYR67421.1 TVP38/TMEM64 family protein [Halorubrum ezzemoulense]
MNRRSALGRYAVAGVLVAAVAAVTLAVSPEAALSRLRWLATDPLRFGAAVVALAAVRPLLAWPTTLLAVAVGFGYGWAGTPLALALVVGTALPPYALARAGRFRLRDGANAGDASGIADRFCRAGERFAAESGSVRAVTGTRLLPLPSDAVTVGAAAAGVGVRPFIAGTAFGELPWVLAGVAVGVSLDRLAASGGSLVDPAVVLGMAAVGVLILAGPLYRTFLRTDATTV